MESIQESILDQVKKELNITGDLDSDQILCLLIQAWKEKHPDKYTDEQAKEKAEEEFKRLGILLDNFRLYLDRQKVNRPSADVTLYEEEQRRIDKTNEIASLYKKIFELQDNVQSLKQEAKEREKQIETLQKDNSELLNKQLDKSYNELSEIYKPQKGTKIIGLASTCILILGNIKIIKDLIDQVLTLSDGIINWIFSILLLYAILSLAYSYFCNFRLIILCSKFSTLSFLSQKLSIHKADEYPYYYNTHGFILETDIETIIIDEIQNSKVDRILFAPKQALIQKEIKNYIITDLHSKKIIDFGSASNLNRKFTVSIDKMY